MQLANCLRVGCTLLGALLVDAAGDADGDNDYVVTLSATEADGQSATQTVTISVTDENDEVLYFRQEFGDSAIKLKKIFSKKFNSN